MLLFVLSVGQLESIERVNQTEWKTDVVLPSVSFAPLILPSQESVKDLEALEIGEKNIENMHLCIKPNLYNTCTIDVYSGSCGTSLTEAVLSIGGAQVLGEREISQDMRPTTA